MAMRRIVHSAENFLNVQDMAVYVLIALVIAVDRIVKVVKWVSTDYPKVKASVYHAGVIQSVSGIDHLRKFCIAHSLNIGSENTQCATDGRCQCKPGVIGDKCNQCAPYYYNFGPNGCTYVNLSLVFCLYVVLFQ